MATSKPKTSFAIDDLLCNNPKSITVPASIDTHLSENECSKNNRQMQLFASQMDFNSSKYYFHQYQPYTDLTSAFHRAAVNNFMHFYSQPFGGYLPGFTFKRKGGQVRFTQQQTHNLERQFNNHKYLSPEDRKQLAIRLKLSDRQVKTWFQNRRAKWRRSSMAKNFNKTDANIRLAQDVTTNEEFHSQANYSKAHDILKNDEHNGQSYVKN